MRKNIYKHSHGRKIQIVLLLFFSISAFLLIQESLLYEAIINGDYEYIKTALADSILYVYSFMLFIMIIQNSFTIIPLILVITVNISVFGFLAGFLWSWFTSVLAAIIIFLSTRYLFTDQLSSKIAPEQLRKIEEKGFAYVLIGRVFPFVPTSLINIIAGLSSISLNKFIFGTIIGNFIYFLILALIPAGLYSSGVNEFMIGTIIILLVAACYVSAKLRVKMKTNAKETEDDKLPL